MVQKIHTRRQMLIKQIRYSLCGIMELCHYDIKITNELFSDQKTIKLNSNPSSKRWAFFLKCNPSSLESVAVGQVCTWSRPPLLNKCHTGRFLWAPFFFSSQPWPIVLPCQGPQITVHYLLLTSTRP